MNKLAKMDKDQKQKNYLKKMMETQLDITNQKVRESRQENMKNYTQKLSKDKTYPKNWLNQKRKNVI